MFIAHKISTLLFIFQMSLTPCLHCSPSSQLSFIFSSLTHLCIAETWFEYFSWDFPLTLLTAILTSYYHHQQQQHLVSCSWVWILLVVFEWERQTLERKWNFSFLPKKRYERTRENEFVVKASVRMKENVWWLPWAIEENSLTKLKINLLYIMLGIASSPIIFLTLSLSLFYIATWK